MDNNCNIDFLNKYGYIISEKQLERISKKLKLHLFYLRDCLKSQGYYLIYDGSKPTWIHNTTEARINRDNKHYIEKFNLQNANIKLQNEKVKLEYNFKKEIEDLKDKHDFNLGDNQDSLEECEDKLELANAFIYNMIDCLLENFHLEILISLRNCLRKKGSNPYLSELSGLVDRKILEERAYEYLKNLVSSKRWEDLDNLQDIKEKHNDETLVETIISQGLVTL